MDDSDARCDLPCGHEHVSAGQIGSGRRPAVAVLALTGRRHWPAVVLLVTTAAIAISVALGYPTGPIWATPLIALYSTAATGRRRLALLGVGRWRRYRW
jgi:hypothetical protein